MIKVLCIGDSITEGFGSTNPDVRSYPAQLQRLLGDAYEVKNFGYGGRTLMTDSDWPYVKDPCYMESLSYPADIVIIMLGTNDTRDYNFERIDKFTDDMTAFIESYQSIPSSPKVYTVTSPKIFQTEELAERCRKINEFQRIAAKRTGSPVIEFAPFSVDMDEQFPDGLHPNDTGYVTLAQFLYENIFGGTLYNCTVNTVPHAAVDFFGQTLYADENGVAHFKLPFGLAPLVIRLDGYATLKKTVDISGNTEINAPLAKGAVNISKNCVAVASSVEGDMIPENAVDGKLRTRWASSGEGNEQTLTIDLGTAQEISAINIYWEIAFARGYNITVSTDGESETTIYSTDSGHGTFEEITLDSPAFGRYVSINMTQKGTYFGYSIWEFEVFGKEPKFTEPPFEVVTQDIEIFTDSDFPIDENCTADYIPENDGTFFVKEDKKKKNLDKKKILTAAAITAGAVIGAAVIAKLLRKKDK